MGGTFVGEKAMVEDDVGETDLDGAFDFLRDEVDSPASVLVSAEPAILNAPWVEDGDAGP